MALRTRPQPGLPCFWLVGEALCPERLVAGAVARGPPLHWQLPVLRGACRGHVQTASMADLPMPVRRRPCSAGCSWRLLRAACAQTEG